MRWLLMIFVYTGFVSSSGETGGKVFEQRGIFPSQQECVAALGAFRISPNPDQCYSPTLLAYCVPEDVKVTECGRLDWNGDGMIGTADQNAIQAAFQTWWQKSCEQSP